MYRRAGAQRTYAHAPNLRETPTRHVYPLPFERIRGLGGIMASCLVVEEWETFLSRGLKAFGPAFVCVFYTPSMTSWVAPARQQCIAFS